MYYQEKIVASPIILTLRKTSFAVFEQWMASVIRHENVPDVLFDDVDRDRIATDFSDSLSNAINNLTRNFRKRRTTLDWGYGYVCGFMQDELHERWLAYYLTGKYNTLKRFLAQASTHQADDLLFNGQVNGQYHDSSTANREVMHSSLEALIQPLEKIGQQGITNHCPNLNHYLTQKQVTDLLTACDSITIPA